MSNKDKKPVISYVFLSDYYLINSVLLSHICLMVFGFMAHLKLFDLELTNSSIKIDNAEKNI